ncbi:MAG: tetratricopeptide repeat protein, partial [Planctomycetota bacterium]
CESKLREVEGDEGPNVKYFQARRLLDRAKSLEEIEPIEALQDEIEAERPEWAAAHLLEGLILERRGRLHQASRALGDAVEAYNEAIEAYKEAIRLGNRSVTVYQRLIGLVYETRRFDEADQYLTEFQDLGFAFEEATPLETGIAVGLALTSPATDLRARGEKLDLAIEAAERSVAKRPEDALQHTLLANLLFLASQNALARSQEATGEKAASLKEKATTLKTGAEAKFADAIKLDPTDLRVHYAQFDYLVRSGQRRSATEGELTDEEKEDEPTLTAEAKIEELEKKGGLVRHEQALVVGYMYERLGEREKAEQSYREADKIVQELDEQAPSPKTFALKIAVKKRLAALLSQSDLAEATEVYREINRLQPGSSSAVQSLAAALAVQSIGRYDEEGEKLWEESQRLLKSAGPESEDPSANQRLQAIGLFQRGGKENLQEAQRLLEQLAADAKRSADVDHLVLARIHEAQSTLYRAKEREPEANEELQRAREQHKALVSRPDPNPSFLLSFIDFLLRNDLHDDSLSWRKTFEELAANNADLLASYVGLLFRHGLAEEASLSLKHLEELDRESLRTIGLRARWLDASGEQSKIEPLVEEVANKLLEEKAGASEEERAQTCLQVGNIYSRVKLYELAEPWYRRVVELLPKGYAPLALSLALQGRTTEAIRLSSEAAKRDGPLGAALVLASVLTQGQPTAEDYQFAEPTLSQAVQENGDNPELLFAVANVRIVQGRIDDAIRLYEKVLELRPKDYRVLNNLATMLSEQPDRRDEALRRIDEAIEHATPLPSLLDTKGTILIHLDRAEEAVHWLEEAVSGAQPDPRFVFHLAVAYDKVGETEKARSALQRAKDGNLEGQILTDSDREFLADLERKYGNAE